MRDGELPTYIVRAHLGDLLVHRAVHNPVQLYISVFNHNADGSLWIQRIFLERGIAVDRHSRAYAQLVVKFREWQDVNFVLHVTHARRVLHKAACGGFVSVAPGLATDAYDAV